MQNTHLLKTVLKAFLEVAHETWEAIVVQQQQPTQSESENSGSHYGLESIIQPLVVAKEFILDLLDMKGKKRAGEVQLSQEQLQVQKQNMHNFLESGEEDMMRQFEKMTLSQCPTSRKGSIRRVSSLDSVTMVHIQKIDK